MALLSRIVIVCYSASLVVWAFLWKGRLPYHIDTRLYAYPDHAYNLQSFQEGLLPLWNPYIACGVPHLANWQSAFFYPPFWLFDLTGLSDWMMWMALAHAAFAFYGCYLWLKSQKAEPLWAALGALSLAGSAHFVSCWANIPFIATAAWIPWIFWAAARSLQNHSPKNWLLLLSFIALQVLAGYPFFTFYTLLFLIVWFENQKPSTTTRLNFFAALTGAGFLTCVQWLPFFDFLSFSWHDFWTDYPYFTKPVEYLTLLKPDALGILGTDSYKGSFANAPFNLYLGLVPLALLAWRLIRRNLSLFWTFSTLFFFLWLAGYHLIIWRWLPRPLLEFLEPSKAVGLFIFCVVTSIASQKGPFSLPKRTTLAPWPAFVVALWLLDIILVPFRLHHPMPDPFHSAELEQEASSIRDLLPAGRLLSLHPAGEMAFPGDQALERSFERPVHTFLPNSNMAFGLRSAEQYLYLQVDGSQNLTRYINKGFRDGYSGGLLDLAGVRLFLMPQVPAGAKYRTIGNFGGDLLILNSKAAADTRWVGDKVEMAGRPEILQELSANNSQWEQKVYLERTLKEGFFHLDPLAQRRALLPLAGYPRPSAGQVSLMEAYKSPGYAILNETYCPGWHAWVDGEPAPVLRAYGLFMAVPLTAGGHQVDFRYEPTALRLGLFISLVMLSLLVGLGLKRRRF